MTAVICTQCDLIVHIQYSERVERRPCRMDEASSDNSTDEIIASLQHLHCVGAKNNRNKEWERDAQDSLLWYVLHGCSYMEQEMQ